VGVPETKGILLISIVADVSRLEREGQISREDLEEELGPEALKVIDTGLSPVSWYSPLVYRDLARVLMRREARGLDDMEYLRKRGERAGERLLESGLYQQLDYMKRQVEALGGRRVDRERFEQSLRLIVSMPAALMKGGKWTIGQDPDHPDRVQIVVTGVEGLPEENAQATCGILTGISLQGGRGFTFEYLRPDPDRIVYRMDRDISALGDRIPERKG
jgi:hypothetical protein